MVETTYQYKSRFLYTMMPTIMFYFLLPISFLIVLITISDIINGEYLFDLEGIIDLLIRFSLFTIYPIAFLLELNILPEIIITDTVIKVRYFHFRWSWIEISWSEICEVQLSNKTYRGKKVWLVSIPSHLTVWHKFLNRKYGKEGSAEIYITNFIKDSDKLIETIKQKSGLDKN